MLNIGMMNRSITIERETETLSPSGDPRKNWSPLATVRAELIQQSANEFITGYGEAQTGTVIFRVRYRPGITTADRVTYDGIAYGIKEIKTIGRRHALELRGEALT